MTYDFSTRFLRSVREVGEPQNLHSLFSLKTNVSSTKHEHKQLAFLSSNNIFYVYISFFYWSTEYFLLHLNLEFIVFFYTTKLLTRSNGPFCRFWVFSSSNVMIHFYVKNMTQTYWYMTMKSIGNLSLIIWIPTILIFLFRNESYIAVMFFYLLSPERRLSVHLEYSSFFFALRKSND
jgi:hypothetical protein